MVAVTLLAAAPLLHAPVVSASTPAKTADRSIAAETEPAALINSSNVILDQNSPVTSEDSQLLQRYADASETGEEITDGAETAWVPLATLAARGVVAVARAIPGAYNALASSVRAGYGAFNNWCVNNPALCAIPTGVGAAAVYDALTSII